MSAPVRVRRVRVPLSESGSRRFPSREMLGAMSSRFGVLAAVFRSTLLRRLELAYVLFAFGEWATCLNGEVNTLGYPRAALFAFCVALVSYNVLGVVKAALRSAHGEEAVEGLSFYYLADEVAGTHRGTMIAIPEDEWAVFHGLTAVEFSRILLDLAAGVRLSSYRKQARGPKRPQPKRESGAKIKHVSTAKLLENRKKGT